MYPVSRAMGRESYPYEQGEEEVIKQIHYNRTLFILS